MLQDFRSLEPRNWDELAAAARFLAGVYGQSFRSEAMALCAEHGMPDVEQLAASFLARHYASLGDQAYAVQLGAQAAALEGRPGSFDHPAELISRIAEAAGNGAIIHGFVSVARTIVIANTLFRADTGADVTDARSRAAEELLDVSVRRTDEQDRFRGPVRPYTATIVDIVHGELGVLPDLLRETIQGVMDVSGGPK